jgi:hypothetical protein
VTSEVTYTSQLSPSIGGFPINLVPSWGEDARGEIERYLKLGALGIGGVAALAGYLPARRASN